jgi:mannose-6-phosphate isomerase-like protein (cupin superfamily)
MIRQGDEITNARTGQVMIFLKTSTETIGELLQIECFSPASLEREPEHIHPFQENSFEIISGSCIFHIDGKEQVIGPGQSITIPAKVPHHFWNAGDTVAHYIQEFRPALKIDRFFETFFALARDGKLNKKGIPNFFHVSVIGLAYKDEIRLTNPPWALQNIIYKILSPFGKLMGYEAENKSIIPSL